MNTSAIVTRSNSNNLPEWNPNAPGYVSVETSDAVEARRQASRIRGAFTKYWWIVLLTWALVAIPASIYFYVKVPPEYVAKGEVEVAPMVSNPVKGTESANPFYGEYIRTQAEMMKNPFVLSRAAEDVRLKKYAWFREMADQVRYLDERVQVQASNQAIFVTMAHRDAEAATAIVDAIIDAYFRARNELDDQNVDKSLKILKQLQATTDKSLRDAQEKLAHLEADGGSSWTEDERKVVAQVIAGASQTLSKLQADQINLIAQRDSIEHRPPPTEQLYKASILTDNDLQIDRWQGEKAKVLVADNVLASKKATPQHPDRVEYRKQLKTLEEKIANRRKEIQDTAWSTYISNFEMERTKKLHEMDADLGVLKDQIASMHKNKEEQEKLAKELGNKTVPVFQLKEQIADSKEALKRYNDRIAEIENQTRAPGRVTLLGPTVQPKTPTVDRWPKLAAAANGLGLLLGFGVLVVLMRLRDRIDRADDLPEHFQALVVGTVSHAAIGSPSKGTASLTQSGGVQRRILGEEMRLLHANLLPPGRTERRVMMITSPTPSNGKTSIAANLALSLAKGGLEVLLIDADLRKRDLTTMFDIGFRAGLSDLLQGKAPELVQPIELLPNLRVLGAGSRLERNPAELLQRKHFHENLAQLHQKFDCIVIDTPPALVVADARLIARSCDEVLCVVRANLSSPREVNQTIDAMTRITGKTPKIIVNGVAHRQSYYKYKYSYTTASGETPVPAEATVE